MSFASYADAQQQLPQAPLQQIQKELTQTIQNAEFGVVAIATFETGKGMPSPMDQELLACLPGRSLSDTAAIARIPSRIGMGTIVKIDAESRTVLILTNADHLQVAPDNESRIFVQFPVALIQKAEIQALDPASNLAVLRSSVPERIDFSSLYPIQLAESDQLAKGTLVLLIEDPIECFRSGSPAARLRMFENRGDSTTIGPPIGDRLEFLQSLFPWVQLDSANLPGAGGGPVIDLQGTLLAMTDPRGRSSLRPAPRVDALPMTAEVRQIIQTLIAGQEVEYGEFAVAFKTADSSSLAKLQSGEEPVDAVQVAGVASGSFAERSGLRADDLVLTINESPVRTPAEILRKAAFLPPGTRVEIKIFRPTTRFEENLSIRLGKWAIPGHFPPIATVNRFPPRYGLQVDFPQTRWDEQTGFPVPKQPTGVLIRAVVPGSPAKAAGLKPGLYIAKVGEEPVETPEEFENALKYWSGRVPLTVEDGREIILETKP